MPLCASSLGRHVEHKCDIYKLVKLQFVATRSLEN